MAAVTFKYKRPPGLNRTQWIRLATLAVPLLKQSTPVATGHLKQNWKLAGVTQRQAVVRNDVDYAEYVNNGTPHMAARDMTGKAMVALNSLAGKLR